MDWQEMYDILLESGLATEGELEIACALGGCNEDTMERVLFYRTGWRSFSGWMGDNEDD